MSKVADMAPNMRLALCAAAGGAALSAAGMYLFYGSRAVSRTALEQAADKLESSVVAAEGNNAGTGGAGARMSKHESARNTVLAAKFLGRKVSKDGEIKRHKMVAPRKADGAYWKSKTYMRKMFGYMGEFENEEDELNYSEGLLNEVRKDIAVDHFGTPVRQAERMQRTIDIKKAEAFLGRPADHQSNLDCVINVTLRQLLELIDQTESGVTTDEVKAQMDKDRASYLGHQKPDADVVHAHLKRQATVLAEGDLCLSDFKDMLAAHGLKQDDAEKLMALFDENHDGVISKMELRKMIIRLRADTKNKTWQQYANKVSNYEKIEKDSQVWFDKTVAEQLAKTQPNQKHPYLFVPYGPPGSGKSAATDRTLDYHGLTVADCIEANIDNLVKSYMKEVLSSVDLFKEQSVYFAVRKGWPSRASLEIIKQAIATKRHLIKESTGRKLSTSFNVIRPAKANGYNTVICYPLTPLLKIVCRVLARKKETGQGHPPFQELGRCCRQGARNLWHFVESGGERCTVSFLNNCGPFKTDHLVLDDAELYAVAVNEPWQHEMKAMLMLTAQEKAYKLPESAEKPAEKKA